MEKFSNFNTFKLIKEDAEIVPLKGVAPVIEQPAIPEVTKSEPAKFISKLFESREMAHVYHLQARGEGSDAAHRALNDYYSGILEFIDELIEIYQGQYDIIENYEIIDTSQTLITDRIEYFISLAEFIKSTRNIAFLPEDTHLHNIIDEVVALIYKTLYKLKILK